MSTKRKPGRLGKPKHEPVRVKHAPKQQVVVPGVNVYEAALGRIRWLFEEFDGNVAVANSGGKDSTVVLELAAQVNRELGLPPLRVIWLDQECEFEATVTYQRYLMYERDDIDFHWYQIPFRLENCTNSAEPFMNVWDPENPDIWIRPKEPGSIHENPYPFDHFYKLLSSINQDTAPCVLSGMRAEESPNRRMTLTAKPVYKWVTWGSYAPNTDKNTKPEKARYRFHPIYDWSYRDVWKAIYENDWRYNTHYDSMFRYGVPLSKMRVSNYHHETALWALTYLQEIEPATWEAATRRLQGISTYGHLKRDQYVTQLPYMFGSWDEYALHLISNLVPDEEGQREFLKQRDKIRKFCPQVTDDRAGKALVSAVVTNDRWGTLTSNFINANLPKKVAAAAAALTDTDEGNPDQEVMA